jgi:TPP-dependent pyruvate/acetoin dehydrogenase alpha subunit
MSPTKTKTNSEDYLRMYTQMVRIRTFEDNANQLYLSAKMPGLTHMYSGEEAVAVGICEALKTTDKITSTHRGHGHCVAKGAEFKQMFCELLGKEEGYCLAKAAQCILPISPTEIWGPTPSSAAPWGLQQVRL